MKRLIAITFAFVAGWMIYMVAMVLTVYDGVLSLIFQPIMAMLCSGLFVGIALVLGLVLKVSLLARWWRSSALWALSLIFGGLFLLAFGSSLGLTQQYTDQETGRQFTGLHSMAGLVGYFVIIFGSANWPVTYREKDAPNLRRRFLLAGGTLGILGMVISLSAAAATFGTTPDRTNMESEWPMVHRDNQRSGYTAEVVAGPWERKWFPDFHDELIATRVEAIVAEGLCYVGTLAGNFYALETFSPATGQLYTYYR